MASRILVTGGGGRLGLALRAHLSGARFAGHAELDVTDEGAVKAAMAGTDVVVHAAAITNVDACEADPAAATAVNDHGTELVVAAARSHGARVVYLSTDYVFAGDAAPYDEDDPAAPLNAYGRSKLAGELRLDPAQDLAVRTSWLFGAGGGFVDAMLRSEGVPRVVHDQVSRPTGAGMLARAIAALVERPDVTGRVHVAGDGPPCSRADLADAALAAAGRAERVERVDSAAFAAGVDGVVAPRPADSTLQLARARGLGLPLEDWRTSLAEHVRSLG